MVLTPRHIPSSQSLCVQFFQRQILLLVAPPLPYPIACVHPSLWLHSFTRSQRIVNVTLIHIHPPAAGFSTIIGTSTPILWQNHSSRKLRREYVEIPFFACCTPPSAHLGGYCGVGATHWMSEGLNQLMSHSLLANLTLWSCA